MRMRKLWTNLWIIALAAMVGACSEDGEGSVSSPSPEVTVIYSVNGLGDDSYNDNICRGVYNSKEKWHFRLNSIVPTTTDEAKQAFTDWLSRSKSSNARQLLLLAGDSYEEYVREYASEIPDDDCRSVQLLESRADDLPAYTSFLPLYGASYEAGCLVSQIDTLNNVLVLTANDSTQPLIDGSKGFCDGYQKECQTYALSKDKSGFYMADTLYIYGYLFDPYYDFIYPLVGGSIQGLLHYTREYQANFLMSGMDVNMNEKSNNVLFSVVKHIDLVVEQNLGQWFQGIPLPRHQRLGMDKGMTEVILSPNSEYYDRLKAIKDSIHNESIEKENQYEASY